MKNEKLQEHILGQSVRINNKSLVLSVISEVFLCRLLGKTMLNSHGVISQKTWKKILKRIAKILAKSIDNNIISDQFHISRIKRSIEQFKKQTESEEVVDNDMVLILTKIILELIGGVPDYSDRRALNKKSDYFLNHYRCLQYHQSPYNKMRTILEASRYTPYSEYHKYDDLQEVYYSQFNGNAEGFIDWYKKEYTEVYIKIF